MPWKVYLVNAVDAVAARSLRAAVDWYEKETGCTQENGDVLPDDEIEEKRYDPRKRLFDEGEDETVPLGLPPHDDKPFLAWTTEL